MVTPAERPPIGIGRRLLFTVLAVAGVFVILESGLRLAGFRHPTTVESMAFTFPIDDYNRGQPVPFLDRDDVLFWKLRPSVLDHNSKGTVGPEFSVAKPPGRFRIIALGDSCTYFGPEPYPQRLQARLNAAQPGRFEVINAGVIGYTSYQGLQRLTHEVASWSADLVIAYFGWNDHWLARGYSDREQPAHQGFLPGLVRTLDRLRVFQGLEMIVGRRASVTGPARYRVSLEDYGNNLREMKRATDAMGATLWLITAPHAFDLGIPKYLTTSGEVSEPSGLIALHDSYNEQVRQIARELGITVVDLDQIISTKNKAALFIEDHIHLSDGGRTLAADTLFEALASKGLVNAPPVGRR